MVAAARERQPVIGSAEAERFLSAFSDTVAELQGVLDEETADLSAGRVRAALAREERKGALAALYLKGLEQVRANAVSLARFAPAAAGRLRDRHDAFREAILRNQAVLETARAVSEGFVKGVAEEMARTARPSGYGAPLPGRPSSAPMVYSGRF